MYGIILGLQWPLHKFLLYLFTSSDPFFKLHVKVDIPAGLMYEFGKNSVHLLSNESLQFSMLVQSNEQLDIIL